MADTKTVFYGTGRRKKSIARVRLVEGNGTITVNGRDLNEYFGADTLKVYSKTTIISYRNIFINMMLYVQ